jgi:predicted methyltransferase MtxX (methanogen marker protein 4)
MAKKNISPFFSPIEIAANLMQVQQGRIAQQVMGREQRSRRTLLEGEPVDDLILELGQEIANGKRKGSL